MNSKADPGDPGDPKVPADLQRQVTILKLAVESMFDSMGHLSLMVDITTPEGHIIVQDATGDKDVFASHIANTVQEKHASQVVMMGEGTAVELDGVELDVALGNFQAIKQAFGKDIVFLTVERPGFNGMWSWPVLSQPDGTRTLGDPQFLDDAQQHEAGGRFGSFFSPTKGLN